MLRSIFSGFFFLFKEKAKYMIYEYKNHIVKRWPVILSIMYNVTDELTI